MNHRRKLDRLSIVALALLGVSTAAVSAYALVQHRPASGPAPSLLPGTSASASSSPSVAPTTTIASPTPTSPTGTVVVIGDTYSLDAPEAWVAQVTSELAWTDVVNLSAAGRGFTREPRTCLELDPCTTFGGSVDLIVSYSPAVVVTFGGSADGNTDITDATVDYFTDLRAALPDAHLIAINPLTTRNEAPSWLTDSQEAIASATTDVDGHLVDVGQPGLGDGDALSAEAHAIIARAVVAELSAS